RQQSGVRRFAAESLSFLIRKLRGDALQKFVEHVIHALVECPSEQQVGFRDGIALLFFECMRSVKSQLHSRASGMLTALLRELYKEEFSGGRLESNDVYLLVASVVKLCLHHADREAAEQLWSVLLDQFDAQVRAIGEAEATRIQPFAALQGLLALSTMVRKGASVSDYKPLFQRCRQSFELVQTLQSDARTQALLEGEDGIADILSHERIKWLSGLLVQCNVSELVTVGKMLLDLALTVEPTHSILSMALTLARIEWSQWCQILLPYVVRLTAAKWAEERISLLLFWSELFQLDLLKMQNGAASSVITERGLVLFPASVTKEAKDTKSSKLRQAKQEAAPSISRALIDWLAEPVEWSKVVEQRMAIPSTDRVEFSGFEDAEDSDAESDTSSAPAQAATAKSATSIPELAIKSAILTMLGHISIEASMLIDGLRAFIEQLVTAISTSSAQLAEDNIYLQHVSMSPSG
ncbi:U3 snoRNP protein, partial [Coemansia aciculifera]